MSLGYPLPKSYSKLGRKVDNNILTKDFERELMWSILTTTRYEKQINAFISLKRIFDTEFLKGNYENAYEILEQIESTLCVSLWSIEKKILTVEYKDGVQKNKKLLQKIAEGGNDPLLVIIADHFSKRSEKNLSPEKYDSEVSNTLAYVKEIVNDSMYNYVSYHISYFKGDLPHLLNHILYWAMELSVIDRYLVMIFVTQLYVIYGEYNDKKLTGLLKRLYGDIKDYRIRNLLLFLNPDEDLLNGEYYKTKMQAIDLYTTGRYEECINLSGTCVEQYPDDFEFYDLFVKSHLYLNKKVIINNDDSIKNNIIICLQNIYCKEEKIDKFLGNLRKIIYLIGKCSLSFALFNVYLKESGITNDNYNKLYYLNLKHPSPIFCKLYPNLNDASVCLSSIEMIFPKSATVQMFQNINNIVSCVKFDSTSTEIPAKRRDIYIAKALAACGKRDDAIATFELIHDEVSRENRFDNLYVLGQVSHNLYTYYIENSDFEKAIALYLKCYYYNTNLCKRLTLTPIISFFETEASKTLHDKVCYPVVTYLHFGISKEAYISYDNFLFHQGLNKASEYVENLKDKTDESAILFLAHVCVPGICFHSVYFDSTDELEEERITICQKLIEIDTENSAEYSREIGELTQNSVVRQGIRQVEESKIYVDINGIKESGQQILNENFRRYQEFASLSDKEEVAFLNLNSALLGEILGGRQLTSDARTASLADTTTIQLMTKVKPGYKLFTEFFYEIRDRFISSNEHGLDSYLSVRIRHGTLLGHLRRQFDSEQLVTKKQASSDKEYQPNIFWKEKLEVEDKQESEELQVEFSEFSKNIDNIINRLRDKLLQIKTEQKNIDGLFNYIFEEYELGIFYNKEITPSMTFDEITNSIFDLLWKRTEYNLKYIRKAISNDLLNEFLQCLKTLEHNIKSMLPNNSHTAELSSSVATCRTNIQNELSNMSRWFTLSQGKLIHKFNFQLAIDTSVKIINNIYPNAIFEPHISVSSKIDFDGKHFPAFIDILMILFNNIITHSGFELNKLEAKIIVQNDNDDTILKVINSVKDPSIRASSLEKMCELKKSYTEKIKTDAVRKEGNTGIVKIINIMQNVLGTNDCDINFMEEELNKICVILRMPTRGLIYEDTNC